MKKVCIILVLFLCFPATSQAYIGLCCGKCGGNMPTNIAGGGIPATHEFRLKVSPVFMKMEGLRNGSDSIDVNSLLGMPVMMGQPTGKYMAAPTQMNMRMINLTVGYSFTDNFFAGLMFMKKNLDMEMKFSSMMQTQTGKSGFTMKSDGMADTMLMTKYRIYADDPLIPTSQVSLFMGVNLPTGSINEKNTNHPVAIRSKEQLPYAMQLGSGTFDPTLGVLYQGSLSPVWWGSNIMYTSRFYKNSRRYSLGNQFRADAYIMYQLRYDLVVQLQLNDKIRGEINGEMDEATLGTSGRVTQNDPSSPYATNLWDPDNYGGHEVFITTGIQWQPYSMHIVDLMVGVPLYRNSNGDQLEQDYKIMLTWYMELPTSASIRYMGGNKDEKSNLGF